MHIENPGYRCAQPGAKFLQPLQGMHAGVCTPEACWDISQE
jgi:hypothetical protein